MQFSDRQQDRMGVHVIHLEIGWVIFPNNPPRNDREVFKKHEILLFKIAAIKPEEKDKPFKLEEYECCSRDQTDEEKDS